MSMKRSFDCMMESAPSPPPSSPFPPCVEHRVSFLSSPTPSYSFKRACTPQSTPTHHAQNAAISRQHSPFLTRPSDITSEEIEVMFSRRKRSRLASAMCDSDDEQPTASAPPSESEPKYTKEEVKSLLEKALKEMESKLREQYDAILQDRLTEQFENFTRFNEDYVSRRIRSNAFEYVS